MSLPELVGLIGGVLVIVGVIVGVPVFLFMTFQTKDGSDDQQPNSQDGLVDELRDQLEELRRELRKERTARGDENDRHQRQIAELQAQVQQLTITCEVLRDRLNSRAQT